VISRRETCGVGLEVLDHDPGLAILRGADLPNWLGWVAVLLGIAAIVPPASFIALGVLVIWSLVVTILMYRRSGEPAAANAVPAPQLA
jgi:hypothetical protein